MLVAKMPARPTLDKAGRIAFRSAVAYAARPAYKLPDGLTESFMLSVYVHAFARKTKDTDTCWALAARMHVARTTPETDQQAFIEAMQYAVAACYQRDFHVRVPANPKAPKKVVIRDLRDIEIGDAQWHTKT